MSDDTILTTHPDPAKRGVRINRAKYDTVKAAILEALDAHGELTFYGLIPQVEALIGATFDGSVGWYVTTVKLDLQARGIITAQGSPQIIRRAEA